MAEKKNLNWAIRVLLAAFLITLCGGGVAIFVNLFVPFLDEGARAIIGLVVLAEIVLAMIAGKCIQVVSAMRRVRTPSAPVNDYRERRKPSEVDPAGHGLIARDDGE